MAAYDRAVQLARLRMDEMLLDTRLPRNTPINGANWSRTSR